MLYCEDCKFYQTTSGPAAAVCIHEQALLESPVSPSLNAQKFCSVMRTSGVCGPSGTLFEAKNAS